MDARELRVDGGPTGNAYLMEFQSGILDTEILVPDCEELSGLGAAYAAGMAAGLYDEGVFAGIKHRIFAPKMDPAVRERKLEGWKKAVGAVLSLSGQEMECAGS